MIYSSLGSKRPEHVNMGGSWRSKCHTRLAKTGFDEIIAWLRCPCYLCTNNMVGSVTGLGQQTNTRRNTNKRRMQQLRWGMTNFVSFPQHKESCHTGAGITVPLVLQRAYATRTRLSMPYSYCCALNPVTGSRESEARWPPSARYGGGAVFFFLGFLAQGALHRTSPKKCFGENQK